jgi:hypothetical protein
MIPSVYMQEFIESYDLPFAPFREIIDTTNSLVAGSSALALYLQQYGVDPGFVPGDMDIWTEDTPELLARSGAHQNSNLQRFTDLFLQHHYYVVSKSGPVSESYEPLHSITKIYEFINRDGKKIQLILLRENNINHYIRQHFDLSICITWWNSKDDRFETMEPIDTLHKRMWINPTIIPTDRELARIQKYTDRGFHLRPIPPACKFMADPRENVSFFGDQTAFDTINYEEVRCSEFLAESDWNILLRIGQQFQAYERHALCEYLKQHECHVHDLGTVYDTPHRQSIPNNSIPFLFHSDFSIFELVPEYTLQSIVYPISEKSIHSIKCYTVLGWKLGVHGCTVDVPPFLSLIGPLLPPEPLGVQSGIPLYHHDVYWMD